MVFVSGNDGLNQGVTCAAPPAPRLGCLTWSGKPASGGTCEQEIEVGKFLQDGFGGWEIRDIIGFTRPGKLTDIAIGNGHRNRYL